MALPVVLLISVAEQALNGIADVIKAQTLADRDIAIERYKTKYLSLKEKLNAKIEEEKIKARKEIDAKKIDATKEILLAMMDFTRYVFTKKIEALQDSRNKISVMFEARIEHFEQEKKQYENQLFRKNNDPNKITLCQKRIGDLDCDIIDLTSAYKISMSEINTIIANLSAPALPLNMTEIRKSVGLLEE